MLTGNSATTGGNVREIPINRNADAAAKIYLMQIWALDRATATSSSAAMASVLEGRLANVRTIAAAFASAALLGACAHAPGGIDETDVRRLPPRSPRSRCWGQDRRGHYLIAVRTTGAVTSSCTRTAGRRRGRPSPSAPPRTSRAGRSW
jgi:hypothetical protein